MELVIAAAVLAVGLVAAATLYGRGRLATANGGHADAPAVDVGRREAAAAAAAADVRASERAKSLERTLDRRSAELDARERDLEAHVERLAAQEEELAHLRDEHERALERVAGLSAGQAKQALLKEVEDQARHDSAQILRAIEEETKRDAERRVRSILSVAMQRLAASHAAETTVSVVQLPSDDMKGRIIGREGRNIRALENLTGVDFIIDDTPNAVGSQRLRRRPPRGRAHDAREAPAGRAHPPGAHRGDLLPGQVRARGPHHRAGREGGLRGRRPGPRPGADQAPRPPALPHVLRPERPRALGRVRAAGGDHGPRARRQREDRAPRRAAARHRQGRLARDRRPARARRRRPGAPPRRARGRRPRDGGPPQRGRAADRRGRHRPGRRRALRRTPRRARRVARALRQAPARPRADRHPPRGRRQGLRDAGRPRDPRHRRARRDRRRRRDRSSPRRSRARSRRSSSTRGRSR